MGKVKAAETVQVGSEVSGKIDKLYVSSGDKIKKNQLMARLDALPLEADLERIKASLTMAEARYEGGLARYEGAKNTLQRIKNLVKKGVEPRMEEETLTFKARELKASVKEAEAHVMTVKAQLKDAKIKISKTKITSPIDGFGLEQRVEEGQVVNASRETPILFIVAANLKNTLITAHVAEADIGRVTKGLPVRFTVDAYPKERFFGKIKAILKSPINRGRSVSYPVIIKAVDEKERLLPGMTASMEFIHKEAEYVLRIPIAALYFRPPDSFTPTLTKKQRREFDKYTTDAQRESMENDKDSERAQIFGYLFSTFIRAGKRPVFILKDNKVSMIGVKLGIQDDEYVEVKSDLKRGDIVLMGAH